YNSQLPMILEKEGYKIDNYSTFDIKDHPAIIKSFFDELSEKLIDGQTLWGRFNTYLLWNFLVKKSSKDQPGIPARFYKRREDYIHNYISQNLRGLDSISSVQDSAPHFVYCH